MEEKTTEINKGGAPTKYKDEFADQAYKLCLLGHTDKELATYFEVEEQTINNWKKEYADFASSIKKGKDIADANVAESFYKRANGYDFEEVTFEKIDNKVNLEATATNLITTDAYKKKIVTKHLPPDASAALNWLKNRQKNLWRDKQVIETEFDKLSDEDLDKLYNKIIEASGK